MKKKVEKGRPFRFSRRDERFKGKDLRSYEATHSPTPFRRIELSDTVTDRVGYEKKERKRFESASWFLLSIASSRLFVQIPRYSPRKYTANKELTMTAIFALHKRTGGEERKMEEQTTRQLSLSSQALIRPLCASSLTSSEPHEAQDRRDDVRWIDHAEPSCLPFRLSDVDGVEDKGTERRKRPEAR